MVYRKLDWTNFKNFATAGMNMQHIERSDYYEIFLLSDYLQFMCKILKDAGSDQTDFEANYKPSSNRPHHYDIFTHTFTATGSGTVRTLLNRPRKFFTVSVKATGAVLTWIIRLQVSPNNVDYTTIGTHTEAIGSGISNFITTPSPALYVRANCTSLSLGLGTNIVVTILGTE